MYQLTDTSLKCDRKCETSVRMRLAGPSFDEVTVTFSTSDPPMEKTIPLVEFDRDGKTVEIESNLSFTQSIIVALSVNDRHEATARIRGIVTQSRSNPYVRIAFPEGGHYTLSYRIFETPDTLISCEEALYLFTQWFSSNPPGVNMMDPPGIAAEFVDHLVSTRGITGVRPCIAIDEIEELYVPREWWQVPEGQPVNTISTQRGPVITVPFEIRFRNNMALLRTSPVGALHYAINVGAFGVDSDSAMESARLVSDVWTFAMPIMGSRAIRAQAQSDRQISGPLPSDVIVPCSPVTRVSIRQQTQSGLRRGMRDSRDRGRNASNGAREAAAGRRR